MLAEDRVSVRCAAKINLYLEVTGKRPDGYHDIVTFFQPVSLYDILRFARGTNGIELTGNDPEIAWNETNLCWKAAEAIFLRAGYSGGVRIEVQKDIPAGAGMGGGSSDAAAVLFALNRLFGFGFDTSDLMEIGLSIGSDVPFFIYGKPAVGRGRGEILEGVPGLSGGWIVIVKPDVSISTLWAYENLKIMLTKKEGKAKLNWLLEGLRNFRSARFETFNSFEDLVKPRYPEIGEVLEILRHEGAILSSMSGSGSACFGLFGREDRAGEVKDLLLKKGFFAKITRPVDQTLGLFQWK